MIGEERTDISACGIIGGQVVPQNVSGDCGVGGVGEGSGIAADGRYGLDELAWDIGQQASQGSGLVGQEGGGIEAGVVGHGQLVVLAVVIGDEEGSYGDVGGVGVVGAINGVIVVIAEVSEEG